MERLCEDLVTDILLCLPAKSAVRFRCLSKYCDQLVSDPRFATSHALRSNPDEVLGLLRFTAGRSADKILFCSFHSKPNIHNNPKVVPINSQIIASCNGLVLGLSDSSLSVCNPILPDRIQIPDYTST
jgi:NifB/MoaA-like Fe-S oxidoreductase